MPRTVLLAHNRYQWLGGEDIAHRLDRGLLEGHGHEVVDLVRHNDEIAGLGLAGRARVAASSIWSPQSRRAVAALLEAERPDVAYFVNTHPLITPSAFAACHEAGVPVVVGLHSYRAACPNAFLFRDGDVCEDCLHRRIKWPGVVHACYRNSRLETAVVAATIAAHDVGGVWHRLVDAFVAVSDFGRDKLVEAGLPAERIVVRPNFTDPDPGTDPDGGAGGFALFVGRLSPEKGVDVLVEGFAELPHVPLKIVGDGVSRSAIEARIASRGLDHVEVVGPLDHDEVLTLMGQARLFVFPAMSYEHCPFVLVEAFARGTPVVASDRGAMPELVTGNDAGALFRPGDAADLARTVRDAWDDHGRLERWRVNARRAYDRDHSAAAAYDRLLEVFERAEATFAAR